MKKIDNHIVSAFMHIFKSLNHYNCFNDKNNFKYFFVKILYYFWGQKIKSDYNHIAKEFNKLFFWKNLLKNLLFFDNFYEIVDNSILDVGCGAAPASIAISKVIEIKKGTCLNIDLVDKSKEQLYYAKIFLKKLNYNLRKSKIKIFDLKEGKYDNLVIFSYFFCEQPDIFLKKLYDNRDKFAQGFVIIDYKDNIEKIENYFSIKGNFNLKSVSLHYDIPNELYKIIRDKEINIYGCYYRTKK